MKNLVNKFKEGVRQVGKKAILPLATTAILPAAAIQNVDAQENIYSYENHNKGATIEKDKIRVEDGQYLEVKMINGRGEYFQNIPSTIEGFPKNSKKISDEDMALTFGDTLQLVSFYKETAQYDLDAYSKQFLEVSSDESYQWVRAKDAEGNDINVIPLSLEINPKTGKPKIFAEILCNEQDMKKKGTNKNESYISREPLEEILKQLTDNLSTMNLNRTINGQLITSNFYFPAATESTEYLIPNVQGNTKLRILPATKNEDGTTSRIRQVAIVSPLGVYEKVKTDGEVIIGNVPISSVSGTADGAYAESIQTGTQEEKEASTPKAKKDLYLIFGANANDKFVEGQAGIQYGGLALVANAGKGVNEIVTNVQTDPSTITGRYALMNEENTDVNVKGIAAEIHPFHKSNISPFVGVGLNKWDYTKNKSIKMFGRSGQQLGSDSESKTNSENSYKANAGVNIKAGKNSKLGVQVNYDSKAKLSGGVRYSRKF